MEESTNQFFLFFYLSLLIMATIHEIRSTNPKPPVRNLTSHSHEKGGFEISHTTTSGAKVGCRGLYVNGREKVTELYVEDDQGYRSIGEDQFAVLYNQVEALKDNKGSRAGRATEMSDSPFVLWPEKCLRGILSKGLPEFSGKLKAFWNRARDKEQTKADKEDKLVNSCAGLQGPNGPAGPAGPSGSPGPAGATGIDGLNGRDGQYGRTGQTGPQGPQGPPGFIGLAGPQGSAGPQGPTGPNGRDGRDGINGSPGVPGEGGEPGSPGFPGPFGRDGQQGPPGPAGYPGKPGTPGTPGAPGRPGTSQSCPGGVGAFEGGEGGKCSYFAVRGKNGTVNGVFHRSGAGMQDRTRYYIPRTKDCAKNDPSCTDPSEHNISVGVGGGGGGGGGGSSSSGGSGGGAEGVAVAAGHSAAGAVWICNSQDIIVNIAIANGQVNNTVESDEEKQILPTVIKQSYKTVVNDDGELEMVLTEGEYFHEWEFVKLVNPIFVDY